MGKLPKNSVEAYESKALAFLSARDKSAVGSKVVQRWSQGFSENASVIELACGGGMPITHVLHEAGLKLWAVDSSPTLLATFRSRFPDIPVQCACVQDADFFHQTYDGVIAIGLIFLLPEPDQIDLISNVADLLLPGGKFLFTAPIEKASWVDINTGVRCTSMGKLAYVNTLREVGLIATSTVLDVGENNYYDTTKI